MNLREANEGNKTMTDPMTPFQIAVIRNAIQSIKHATGADAIVVTTIRGEIIECFPGGRDKVAAEGIQKRLADSFAADGAENRIAQTDQ
jgi:hypothetical protein